MMRCPGVITNASRYVPNSDRNIAGVDLFLLEGGGGMVNDYKVDVGLGGRNGCFN